ncbi:MAG: DUF58 domain-containing protein [bacterium]
MNTQLRFLDPEILSKISGMELRARTVVEGFLSGLHRSPFKGFSVEFAEYRQYTPGDDPRHIDWKVYARSDRYYVKEFEEETNLHCHILLDLSGSMSGTSGKTVAAPRLGKFEYATYLAASLAYFIFMQRDSVGLVAFDQEIRLHVPAKARAGHLHHILLELEKLQASSNRKEQPELLHQVTESFRRKGMVILISDLFGEIAPLARALEHLRFRGHDVIVFQIMDEFELNFDFSQMTRFIGLEGEAPVIALPQAMRERYLQNLQNHLAALRQACGANRVDYTLLTINQPLDFALQAYLAARSGKM